MKIDEFARLPFLSVDDIKDGDIITFTNEGRISDSKAGNRIWTVDVELDGIIVPYVPFGDAVAALKKAWGDKNNNYSLDSQKIIGKSAKLGIRKYVDNQGQDKEAITLTPLVDVKDKIIEPNVFGSGVESTSGVEIDDKDIPVIEEPKQKEVKDKVEIKDVPF